MATKEQPADEGAPMSSRRRLVLIAYLRDSRGRTERPFVRFSRVSPSGSHSRLASLSVGESGREEHPDCSALRARAAGLVNAPSFMWLLHQNSMWTSAREVSNLQVHDRCHLRP